MHKEIGSEFWSNCTPITNKEYTMRPSAIYDTCRYRVLETLSGRTALDHIVELLIGHGMKSAYLPSYCCHTMIEPFLAHGMNVLFYEVVLSKNGIHRLIDENHKCDCILLMDYFGYVDVETNEIAVRENNKNVITIYDATHSMYSKMDYEPYDYIYGSYRKWVDVNCGFLAWKEEGNNGEITQNDNNGNYSSIRTKLFDLKAGFIKGGQVEKDQFLPLINEAEMILENEYRHRMPDIRSKEVMRITDAEYIKVNRRNNAETITEAINELNDVRVRCANPQLNVSDIPLFVPVIVSSEYRNSLRRFLIEHEIYCPVHWPKSEFHQFNQRSVFLFDSELSLICDQRYNRFDMIRIVNTIKNYLKQC